MIHITCDLCGKELRQGEDHYIVKIETFAAHDPAALTEDDLDQDHMETFSQMLTEMDEMESPDSIEPATRVLRYDLCPDCKTGFLRNPLNKKEREPVKKPHFSEN